MKTVQIVIHCLPREIDQLERLCNTLRENYYFVENHINVVLDVTLNLNNRWDLELWNESIDGNAMVCAWISEAKNGYIDSKSILTHCRNVNKKLDSIDPHGRYLWARWII